MGAFLFYGILAAVIIMTFFGPALVAYLIQWLLKRTRVPRSDVVIAIVYALLDITIRQSQTAEQVENLATFMHNYGIQLIEIALAVYLFGVTLYYLSMIKIGKLLIRGVGIIVQACKKRVKDYQHAPPVRASPH